MKKPYGYIYKTTNLVNDKIYIGQTFRINLPIDKYMGSGKLIKYAIKKYGVSNFKKEILIWCNDKDELNQMEKLYIAIFHPEYNLNAGGQCAHEFHHSIESKLKISEALKGKPWSEAKINSYIKYKHSNPTMSEEHRMKLSISHSGKKKKTHITTEEHKRKISESLKGRHLKDETKQKLRESNLGKKHSEETKRKISESLKQRNKKCA